LITLRSIFRGSPRGPSEPDEDPLIAEFRNQVGKASALLDFLIEEGHPYHIPDHIIEDIEAMRESLKTPDPPSQENRVKLLKAYRDLIAIPETDVSFDGTLWTPFWSWHSWWLRAFLISASVPLIMLLLTIYFRPDVGQILQPYWYLPIGYPFLSAYIV
jgi:hypothetical protein